MDDAILEGLFQRDGGVAKLWSGIWRPFRLVGFQRDGGVAKLVESVVNQILQAQVQEQLKAAPL